MKRMMDKPYILRRIGGTVATDFDFTVVRGDSQDQADEDLLDIRKAQMVYGSIVDSKYPGLTNAFIRRRYATKTKLDTFPFSD